MINTPKNLRFTQTHEWLNTEQDEMTMGITEHAQQLLGDMVFVELPVVGDEVQIGDELGVLESVKAASDFYAPISGEIVAVNQLVADNPGLINNDPYNTGWLVKIKAHHLEELTTLLDDEQYQNEIAEDH
ncbi:glycine cleavage system protein GcvH [bacterium]|nr:glycine cleavage system protein GcvH [bacterium]